MFFLVMMVTVASVMRCFFIGMMPFVIAAAVAAGPFMGIMFFIITAAIAPVAAKNGF